MTVTIEAPTATWDDDELGFTFKGVHYTAEETDHEVQLLLEFDYWSKRFKDACVVEDSLGELIYPNERPEKPSVVWILNAGFDLDLYYELHPELADKDEYPGDITELTEEHRLAYFKEVFKRGDCELQNPDVNCIYVNDDTGMEIEEEELAQAFGYDPKATSLICNG